MATRRNRAGSTAADTDASSSDAELIPGDAVDDGPTIEQQIDEFFGESHGDVTCSIYELGGVRHDQRGFLFSFPFVQGYSSAELYEQLLESHGPGWYELSAQRKAGRGWVRRKVFQLGSERDRMRAAMRKADPETAAPRAAEPAPVRSDVSPELRVLIENQNRILERLIDRPERDTLTVARELSELKSLFAPPERKETPVGEIMTLVKDVLALRSELAEGDGDANPLAAALRQFAPAINAAVERLGGAEQSQPAASAQPRPGITAPGRAPLNGHDGGAPKLVDIDALFADLHRRAQADEKPAEVADAVLVYLADRPEWLEAAVLSMIVDERERVVGRIAGSYPPLGAHRDWLTRLVVELLKLIESGDEPEPDAAPETPERGQTEKAQASAGSS